MWQRGTTLQKRTNQGELEMCSQEVRMEVLYHTEQMYNRLKRAQVLDVLRAGKAAKQPENIQSA